MTIESSKSMGGIGAILLVLGFVPFIGAYSGIIALVGLILVLASIKGLADYYKDATIFNNALYGVVTAIIGVVVFIGVMVTVALGLLDALGVSISNWQDWNALSRMNWQSITWNTVAPYILTAIAGLVILFALLVVTAIFERRSMDSLSKKTGVHMFTTAGLLLLIGAILTIVVIGILLIWISFILLAVAFFSIRTEAAPQTATPSGQTQQ